VSLQQDGSQLIRVFSHRGVPLGNFAGGSGPALAAALDPISGGLLIAGPSTSLWDFRSEPLAWVGPPKSDCVFWRDDNRLFLAGHGPASLENISTNETLWNSGTGHGNHVHCSQDGKTAAFEGQPTVFFRAGPSEMEPLFPKTPINVWFHNLMRLSQTGERLLAGSNPGAKSVVVYDVGSGKPVFKLPTTRSLDACWVNSNNPHRQNIVMLCTEQADRGTPGAQETVVQFDGETGGELRSVTHPSSMDVIVASADGKTFIEAGVDQRVRLRNAETLQILREFRAHDGGIISAAWSPHSQTIATGAMVWL
jgi:WD40 repeat protein